MLLNDYEIVRIYEHNENNSLMKVKGKNDSHYLLKKILLKSVDKKEKSNFINEIKLLNSLKHPNILEFKKSFLDKRTNSLNILFEFPNNGSLTNKIDFAIKKKMMMEESIIWEVLSQILLGLHYLNKKGIIHRNLQSKNIYLTKNRLVKISDFNSCYLIKNGNKNKNQINTSSYTAPEILQKQKISFKCDIWSVGCIIYEMASLSLPYKFNNNEQIDNIFQQNYKPIPEFYSENLKSLINDMLSVEPSKRPSINILLNHSNIKEIIGKLKLINIKNEKISNLQYKKNNNNISKINNQTTNINLKRNDNINLTKNNAVSLLEIKKNINDNNKMKKIIRNATYRTLNERKIMNITKNITSQKNIIKRNLPTQFSRINFNSYNINNNSLNGINFNSKKNILNTFSMGNTNINFLLPEKYKNDFDIKISLQNNKTTKENKGKEKSRIIESGSEAKIIPLKFKNNDNLFNQFKNSGLNRIKKHIFERKKNVSPLVAIKKEINDLKRNMMNIDSLNLNLNLENNKQGLCCAYKFKNRHKIFKKKNNIKYNLKNKSANSIFYKVPTDENNYQLSNAFLLRKYNARKINKNKIISLNNSNSNYFKNFKKKQEIKKYNTSINYPNNNFYNILNYNYIKAENYNNNKESNNIKSKKPINKVLKNNLYDFRDNNIKRTNMSYSYNKNNKYINPLIEN